MPRTKAAQARRLKGRGPTSRSTSKAHHRSYIGPVLRKTRRAA